MATSVTTDFSLPVAPPVVSNARVRPNRPRRITAQAGHALEILGHAIEYLTDEFVYRGGEISPRNAQLEAVQLLMGLNRQVYFECPEVTTMGDRLRSMLHLHAA
jgi:hypothetical protein